MNDLQIALERGASLDDLPLIHKPIETAFCKNHPTGYLGKDQWGNWYTKCYTGKKFNEPCEIVVERK